MICLKDIEAIVPASEDELWANDASCSYVGRVGNDDSDCAVRVAPDLLVLDIERIRAFKCSDIFRSSLGLNYINEIIRPLAGTPQRGELNRH